MNCKICGSSEIKQIYIINNIGLSECLKCGVLFTDPLPPKQEVEDFYDNKEYFKHWFEFKETKFLTDSERIKKIIEITGKSKGKLFDYGCGLGYFLECAGKKGFQGYGIEYSKFAAEYAVEEYGLKVSNRTEIPFEYENNFFDIAVMWHTLEHLPEPKKVLLEIFRVLKPGGYIVIEIPNTQGLLQIIRGIKSLPLMEHLFHYTPPTLEYLVKECGFVIKKIGYGNPGYTRKGIKILIKKILSYAGKIIFNLCGKNFADTILVYAYKPEN